MKEKYTSIIIDDEPEGISNLCASLEDINMIDVIKTTQVPQKGKEQILKNKPDLLFLDVEMPEVSGFELLREIKELVSWPMQIVFYTAYDKYLLEALRESAFDYLLKPYTEAEFLMVVNRFLRYMQSEEKKDSLQESLSTLYTKDNTHVLITTIKGYRSLKFEEIGYFEYIKEKKHWFVILENQRIQLKRNTSAEDILKLASVFTQINQQQIINISYLSCIEGRKCIMLPPLEKANNLNISRNFFNSVQDRFFMI
ncbi:MAG: response regulator receiver protein [Bacteroidetes bacterium]|nr:response regulator receiver protein [Bacteroidota bacterium]